MQYIFHWSPLWDLSLILETIWTLLFRGLQQQVASPTPDFHSGRSDLATRKVLNANST
jgi:hypothetical protein